MLNDCCLINTTKYYLLISRGLSLLALLCGGGYEQENGDRARETITVSTGYGVNSGAVVKRFLDKGSIQRL